MIKIQKEARMAAQAEVRELKKIIEKMRDKHV